MGKWAFLLTVKRDTGGSHAIVHTFFGSVRVVFGERCQESFVWHRLAGIETGFEGVSQYRNRIENGIEAGFECTVYGNGNQF